MSNPGARESQLTFQTDFSGAEFIARRKRVMEGMRGQGIALIAGAGEVPGFDPIRQSNDFYYLCGVEVPHAYLIIDAEKGRSTLYLSPRDEKHEASDGPTLCADDGNFCLQRNGVDEVRPISALADDLRGRPVIYLLRAWAEGQRQCQDTLRHMHKCINADPLNGRPSAEAHLLLKVSQLSPQAEIRDLSPVVFALRLIKSPAEVAVMRESGRLTALAATEVMRTIRPGIFEYQLAAVADYFYTIHGAQGAGYRPIIAAGANIWMMHYWRNNTQLKDGELVIFDYAPDYHYYTSDIGRMMPVNGRYSQLQRELYGFVLEYHKLLLALCRPGQTADEILAEAGARMRPIAESWDWSKPIYKAGALKLLESKRPLSHGVGLAIHEAAHWQAEKIQPGLVFTVDPELVIPEEKLYIRVEDTVVATATGIENLTAGAPLELDDVERTMQQSGILQVFPPAT